jgi:hypothetical protein
VRINIVTIFPDFYPAPLATPIPGRAREAAVALSCPCGEQPQRNGGRFLLGTRQRPGRLLQQ